LSTTKIDIGGKGFGRFMYLKYFNEAKIKSQYVENDVRKFRNFRFGKNDEIIVDEETGEAKDKNTGTRLLLENIIDREQLDKGLDVIARKLVEKLLVFFVDTNFNIPQIILREQDNSEKIVLNNYINDNNAISKIGERKISVKSNVDSLEYLFLVKVYKIYYSTQASKICLTAHNREVTETTLHTYVPEFQDDFFDEINDMPKNYIIKSYVLGEYLNTNVSLERESFDFPKEATAIEFYPLSQSDIEKEVANVIKSFFKEDVKLRFEKKTETVRNYVNSKAPWHKIYLNDFDFTNLPINLNDEKIELEFQKFKFKKEQETRIEIKEIIENEENTTKEQIQQIFSRVSQNGKNDLAHYVCNRKLIVDTFDNLRKRRESDNKAHLESELHNLIYPMGQTSETLNYENHNLWLLDERLVFSQYVASDKIISKSETKEPDLIVFNEEICIYRNGENITTSPLTIFEFKRPKRTNYPDEENPIMQACRYAEKIREGKYEMPEGLEQIKVSKETPVYIYVVCDLVDKIHEFAKGFSLTISPDSEGYFGFSSGFNAYIEVMSYRKLIDDAKMRNKIFFKKLGIE
jgi:hypothetical protein